MVVPHLLRHTHLCGNSSFGRLEMDTLEAIKGRRSIREFTDEPISKEILTEILDAARWAPSG
ncbi:MAG: nitroreductase family protein, partial [Anaerolineae bacterium]